MALSVLSLLGSISLFSTRHHPLCKLSTLHDLTLLITVSMSYGKNGILCGNCNLYDNFRVQFILTDCIVVNKKMHWVTLCTNIANKR